MGINFGPIFGFIPGNKWQTDKVENDEAEHDKVVRMKKNNPSKMGPYLCVLACFKTFTFVGATKMGSCGAVFSLAGGGRVKKGKLQICKMAKCKTTTPKAAESLPKGRRRARFARAQTGQKRAGSRSPGIRSFLAFALAEKGLRVIK